MAHDQIIIKCIIQLGPLSGTTFRVPFFFFFVFIIYDFFLSILPFIYLYILVSSIFFFLCKYFLHLITFGSVTVLYSFNLRFSVCFIIRHYASTLLLHQTYSNPIGNFNICFPISLDNIVLAMEKVILCTCPSIHFDRWLIFDRSFPQSCIPYNMFWFS